MRFSSRLVQVLTCLAASASYSSWNRSGKYHAALRDFGGLQSVWKDSGVVSAAGLESAAGHKQKYPNLFSLTHVM